MRFRALLLVPALITGLFRLAAQDDPCLPKAPPRVEQDRLVFQLAPLLNATEEERLDRKLTRFAQETSNRILVLVVDTLCGLPPSDFAFAIGESWGVGAKGFDNGVVVLVKPTGPPGQRKVFIATGYGLEGAIPDLTCKRIVDGEIIPRFKEGDYYAGLDKATDVLMGLAKGEFDHTSYDKPKVPWPLFVMLGLVVLVVVLSLRNSARRYARTNDVDFWTALWLLNQTGRSHSGRWGGFTGGGGWRGGGGGGFGGFGGGGFGGGGAGGSW
ncbi:MAG: TPM domain-containing protein [Flavobacteriales bacterium]|nr:hypothetical protein [Flavobacteriales bacterium]MCC6575782.1 TPM domain-containing protein [Flavobacteriales bacterium]